jgi:hypothetical protein
MKKLILLLLAGFTVACSSVPTKDESTVEVPSFTAAYDVFSCDQLYSEARRIASQMQEIAGVRDEEAQMERLEFIGGVFYWPVLFLVDGRSDSKAAQDEYEQLKNRMLSLSSWVLKKQCGGQEAALAERILTQIYSFSASV